MTTRIVAAVVGLAVLLPALFLGGELAIEVIAALAAIVCLDEFSRMAFPEDRLVAFGWMSLCSALVFASNVFLGEHHLMLAGLVVVLASMIFVTLRPGPELSGAADRLGRVLIGVAWAGSLLSFFVLIRRMDDGLAWLLLALTIPWAGDTGGYFAGRAFGKHKLYPRVSPKKTWEGFAGGMVLATAGVFAFRALALPQLSALECVLLGVGLGALSVVGDLAESMLKRAFDVKDSGWIMPGHGGLLDRIDSVLFVAPALFLYLTLFRGL